MIHKNQECDIVSDLLPLYMDHKTGMESNLFIKEHLEHCEECRKSLQFMEISYEELMSEKFSLNEAKKTRRNKKSIKGFKMTKGRIFVCGYLVLLLSFWVYMVLVLFP